MIKGFANEALFVFPTLDLFDNKHYTYGDKLIKVWENIGKYLKMCDVKVDLFITDDVAHLIGCKPDRWLSTFNRGDLFFASRQCDLEIGYPNMITFDEIYTQTSSKFTLPTKVSVERRFEILLKRDAMARRLIAKTYKIIFVCKQSKGQALRYTLSPNSGILTVEIDSLQLTAKCWMGDMAMDSRELLGVQNAFMPIYEWEV